MIALIVGALLLLSSWAQAATVTLTVVGTPATGAWGVQGTIADTRDVMADMLLDGIYQSTQHTAPYGFPDDVGGVITLKKFGAGSHTVEFIFKLEGTTTEIGRASITVQEGLTLTPPGKVTGLAAQLLAADKTVTLSWDAVTDPTLAGFRVYQSTSPGVYGAPIIAVIPKASTSFVLGNLTQTVRYYWVITAYDIAGQESPYSNEVNKLIP